MSYKIHLIRTPDYEVEEYQKVCELLQSFHGPMEFISTEYQFDEHQFDFLNVDFIANDPLFVKKHSFKSVSEIDLDLLDPLRWEEMFFLCDFYRKKESVQVEDFVVLLTKRRNELNWFSSNDKKKNAFVHTGDWERFVVDVSPKYPIAYQILANIVRSFMDIDLKNIPNQYIHQSPKSCMNDFCLDKKEIIFKLLSARICPDCLARIKIQQVSNEMLLQVQGIFFGIRSEFDFKVDEQPLTPSKVIINSSGDIELIDYGINLNMPALWKSLYILFLRHPEGMLVSELEKNIDELKKIYKICRPRVKDVMLHSTIMNLVDSDGASFRSVKSKLNALIQELLKDPRAGFYTIDGMQYNKFSVSVASEYKLVDIRF